MSAMGRFLPFNILSDDWPLLGESGHRNFDAKPRAYEFANDCFRLEAALQLFEKLSPRSAAIGQEQPIRETQCVNISNLTMSDTNQRARNATLLSEEPQRR